MEYINQAVVVTDAERTHITTTEVELDSDCLSPTDIIDRHTRSLNRSLAMIGAVLATSSNMHFTSWGSFRGNPAPTAGRPVFHDENAGRRASKAFHALGKGAQVSRKAMAVNAGRYKHTQARDAVRKFYNERYKK